jgi:hypothetical protein
MSYPSLPITPETVELLGKSKYRYQVQVQVEFPVGKWDDHNDYWSFTGKVGVHKSGMPAGEYARGAARSWLTIDGVFQGE